MKRENNNLSTADSSKSASKRRASDRSLFGGAPIRKANVSFAKKEKAQSPPKNLSSEFGDDDFDDLPSPSELFGATKSSLAIPESPVVEAARSTDPEVLCVDPAKISIEDDGGTNTGQDAAMVDPMTEDNLTRPLMTAQASQPFKYPDRTRPFEIWEDLSYSSGEDIFTNTEYQESTATTAPLAPSTGNMIRNTKRRASVFEARDQEQSQRLPSEGLIRNAFIRSSAGVTSDSARESRLSTADESSTGLEDIDRGLYEEFQHLINFY